jgi:hypothetical protein
MVVYWGREAWLAGMNLVQPGIMVIINLGLGMFTPLLG